MVGTGHAMHQAMDMPEQASGGRMKLTHADTPDTA